MAQFRLKIPGLCASLLSVLLANASSLFDSPLEWQAGRLPGWFLGLLPLCHNCILLLPFTCSIVLPKDLDLRCTLALLCHLGVTSLLWLTACEWGKEPVRKAFSARGEAERHRGAPVGVGKRETTTSTTLAFDTCWATRFLAGGTAPGSASDLYATFST